MRIAPGADGGSQSIPYANPVCARDCEECRGWGTVVNGEGEHELCLKCQRDVVQAEPDARSPRARDEGVRPGRSRGVDSGD
ncbi:hypothetical protein GCM10022206_24170 [Streptomyces chiangmaiensis]